MTRPVRDVVIVGGGTAGWLTAGIVAARHQGRLKAGKLRVTLVESPNVPIIGVGEGTWPTLRGTLERMGVSETDFIRQCDVSFKQGAKFEGWVTGAKGDSYYHPLMLPQGYAQINLASHWLGNNQNRSFCDLVCPQGALCEEGLAPKAITTPEFQGLANYAYHLDAGKFATFLKRHCVEKLGVRHVLADVQTVSLGEGGDILNLTTLQAGTLAGDFFIDCTGLSSLLLGKTLRVPFRACDDLLFCDRALTVQVPYPLPEAPIASHTLATAQRSGWIWDIGLASRRGVGYVYSSGHATAPKAEEDLARYVGPQFKTLDVHTVSFRPGYRETFWKNNCVAIGLAAGFLEPLEASAIVLVELSAKFVAEQMPACREVMGIVAARFNETTHYRWGRIIDFLKLHYLLSQRTDTAFWRDNRDVATVPDRLRDLIELWRFQAPGAFIEFDRSEEVFSAASYQYVLYGMGFRTAVAPEDLAATDGQALQLVSENTAMTNHMMSRLPKNRELIRKIHEYGLQPI